MYVTFPSSESKIFTLSQGHLAATALSQAGSGCDTVNRGAWGRGNCSEPPEQTAGPGALLERRAPGGGHCQGGMGRWQQGLQLRDSEPGRQWLNTAGTRGQGKKIHRIWTDVSSIPTGYTSHTSLCAPSTFRTWGCGRTNLAAFSAFKELLETLLLFFTSTLGPVKPSCKLLGKTCPMKIDWIQCFKVVNLNYRTHSPCIPRHTRERVAVSHCSSLLSRHLPEIALPTFSQPKSLPYAARISFFIPYCTVDQHLERLLRTVTRAY